MEINLMGGKLAPQEIFDTLYLLPLKIQYCHHNTTSYAQHKALDFAYDALNDLKDDIVEKMLGYGIPRFRKVNLSVISGDPNTYGKQLAQEIMTFGKSLQKFGNQMGFGDIENKAQEYSGVGAKLNYLLTLV